MQLLLLSEALLSCRMYHYGNDIEEMSWMEAKTNLLATNNKRISARGSCPY
jgi:hypothetical protein